MHVPYSEKFKSDPVHPEDVIIYQVEEGALYDLFPSLQVPKLSALLEVPYQVNKAELRE